MLEKSLTDIKVYLSLVRFWKYREHIETFFFANATSWPVVFNVVSFHRRVIKIALPPGRVSIFYSVSFQLRSRSRNGDCFIIVLMRSVVRLFNFVTRFNGETRGSRTIPASGETFQLRWLIGEWNIFNSAKPGRAQLFRDTLSITLMNREKCYAVAALSVRWQRTSSSFHSVVISPIINTITKHLLMKYTKCCVCGTKSM